MTYSHMGKPHTTIGANRFTSEFGMGSGGSTRYGRQAKKVE